MHKLVHIRKLPQLLDTACDVSGSMICLGRQNCIGLEESLNDHSKARTSGFSMAVTT